jgi:uncharacterized protein YutE (UPF0331/DUF86 family)
MTIKKRKIGLPKDSGGSFDILEQNGIIDEPLAKKLKGMVGFRNILVHRYQNFDLDLMVDVIENRLDDPVDFAQIIVEEFQKSNG